MKPAIDPKLAERLRARLGRPPADPSGNSTDASQHERPAPAPSPPPPEAQPVAETIPARPAPQPRHEPAQATQEQPQRQGRGEVIPVRRTRRDIRSISATGRLIQFSSRITPELDARIGEIIERRQGEINAARRGPKYKYGICNFLEEAAFLFENIPTAED